MELYADTDHDPFVMGESDEVVALLVHGFPGTPHEHIITGEALAARGIEAHGILLPGFGKQVMTLPEKTRHDWVNYAAERWAELKRSGKQTVLVGYSMGGAIATHLAADNPPDRLILYAPFWRINFWLAHVGMPLLRRMRSHVSPLDLGNGDISDPRMQKELRRTLGDVDFSDPAVLELIRNEMKLPTAVLEELWRLGRKAYTLAAHVQAETLVIQGMQDVTVNPAHTRKFVQRLRKRSNVNYQEIDGEHEFPKESTDFLKLVHPFLDPLQKPLPV